MQIDLQAKYSKYAELIPVLTTDSREALRSSVCAIYGEYWDMPLKDYFAAIDGDFSRIGLKGEPTVAQRLWLDGLREFGQEFEKACKQVTIPDMMARKYEKQARQACIKVGVKESMLVFVQQYFFLHNFREAENITLAEYIMARRAEFNKIVMQRKMEQLQTEAIKSKRK